MKTLLKIIVILLLINLIVLSLCSNPVMSPTEFNPKIYDLAYITHSENDKWYINFYGTSTQNFYVVSTVIQCKQFTNTYIWNCTDDIQGVFCQKPFSFAPPNCCDEWLKGEYTIILRCKPSKLSEDMKEVIIKINT
jgi:hypothetical protein